MPRFVRAKVSLHEPGDGKLTAGKVYAVACVAARDPDGTPTRYGIWDDLDMAGPPAYYPVTYFEAVPDE